MYKAAAALVGLCVLVRTLGPISFNVAVRLAARRAARRAASL